MRSLWRVLQRVKDKGSTNRDKIQLFGEINISKQIEDIISIWGVKNKKKINLIFRGWD